MREVNRKRNREKKEKETQQKSKRHQRVTKALKASLALTGLFGISSALFLASEDNYVDSLQRASSLKAAEIRISIDKSERGHNREKKNYYCTQKSIKECTDYLETELQSKNWMEDWKQFFENQIGVDRTQLLASPLQANQQNIDSKVKERIGISFKEARGKGILTIDDLSKKIDWKNTNNFSSEASAKEEGEAIKEIENLIATEQKKNPTPELSKNYVMGFLALLITLEVLLFAIVNGVDLVNNNADPEKNFESSLSKIQAKVKPLAISLALTLAGIIISQLLLARQEEDALYEHCREVNQHQIAMANLIDSHYKKAIKTSILIQLMPAPYCLDLISNDQKKQIKKLGALQESQRLSSEEKIEITYEISRVTADSLQRSMSTRSEGTSRMLIAVLMLNVAAMSMLSVFLKYDSEDIG